ncbi:MAG: hypothetical protein QXK83_05210 [Zestosphaera sp.]
MRLHYLDKQLTRKEMLGDTLQKHNQALKEVDEKLKQILTLTPRPEEAKTLGCRILLREIDVCGRDTVDGSKLYLVDSDSGCCDR